jgi:hypothetical protein
MSKQQLEMNRSRGSDHQKTLKKPDFGAFSKTCFITKTLKNQVVKNHVVPALVFTR